MGVKARCFKLYREKKSPTIKLSKNVTETKKLWENAYQVSNSKMLGLLGIKLIEQHSVVIN